MVKEVFMPKLGQTMEEGVINRWFKKEGEWVSKGELLLEIATDKANLEVESFYEGYLRKILYPEGARVPVTTVIALITDTPDEEIPAEYLEKLKGKEEGVKEEETKKVVKKREKEGRVKASPLARKLAREKGVDLSQIKGTGPEGRITAEDVLKYISLKEGEISFTEVKKITARKMEESKKSIPHFYLQIEIDMGKVAELKKSKDLTYTTYILKALGLTLRKHPWFRSVYVNGEVITKEEVNINVAIDTPQGLYAPLIRKVDEKSVEEIQRELKILKEKALKNKLSPLDLEDGVFTLSNLGMLGVECFSAIIPPGQSGILAVGRVKEGLKVEDGAILIRPLMKVVLSCDHRIIDGGEGARFLNTFKTILESGEGLE